MFSQLTDSLESTLKNLRGQGKLTEENVAESLREVRRAFLEADVNFNVTRDFVKAVKEKAMGSEVLTSVTPGQQIVKIIHDELVAVMGGETKEINLSAPAPVGIMMVGLQGSGKTTFAGEIALWMRSKKKRKPLLGPLDAQQKEAQAAFGGRRRVPPRRYQAVAGARQIHRHSRLRRRPGQSGGNHQARLPVRQGQRL